MKTPNATGHGDPLKVYHLWADAGRFRTPILCEEENDEGEWVKKSDALALLATVEAQRKEIERLNAGWQECLDALAIARNTLAAGADERDALKAEVERLTSERDALRGCVESHQRMAEVRKGDHGFALAKLSASEAEVERLRAALQDAVESVRSVPARHAGFSMIHTPQIGERQVARWDAALRGEEVSRE